VSAGTLPTVLRYERSMQNNSAAGLQNSGTETRFQQVLSHLHGQSLGDPTCQVSNEPTSEGEQLILHLYKPAGSSTDSIGQWQDRASQQTSPILTASTLRLRFAQDTITGRITLEPSATDQSGAATLKCQPNTGTGK